MKPLYAAICHLCSSTVTGHGDIFSCCQNDNLHGLPVSFFMIHVLGGMVLFMTDGIVVSEGCLFHLLFSHVKMLHVHKISAL